MPVVLHIPSGPAPELSLYSGPAGGEKMVLTAHLIHHLSVVSLTSLVSCTREGPIYQERRERVRRHLPRSIESFFKSFFIPLFHPY